MTVPYNYGIRKSQIMPHSYTVGKVIHGQFIFKQNKSGEPVR